MAIFKKIGDYLKSIITNPGKINFENKYQDKTLIFISNFAQNENNRFLCLVLLLVEMISVKYQLSWTGPIRLGQVQIIKICLIWIWPKWIVPDQNNLDLTKTIWTRPKQFGQSKTILDLWRTRHGNLNYWIGQNMF